MPVKKLEPYTSESLAAVLRVRGRSFTPSDIAAVLQSVPQAEIIAQEDAAYAAEVWDKTSAINGLKAPEVVRKYAVPSAATVYLVKATSNGHVVIFQPWKPSVGGKQPMTEGEARRLGEDARQTVANEAARRRIFAEVAARL